MESEKNFVPKPEKPPVLFHASRNQNIDVFEPRAEKTRDANEGPQVFGTPSRAMASIFLVESDDSWVESGAMDGIPYIVISDEERFRSLDNGGVIYSLPNDTFENDTEKGLRELEWTSKKPVVPSEKEFVPSALEDMVRQGVKVFFVHKETWEAIKNAPDGGESVVKNLEPHRIICARDPSKDDCNISKIRQAGLKGPRFLPEATRILELARDTHLVLALLYLAHTMKHLEILEFWFEETTPEQRLKKIPLLTH